jgi:hypothetical protein
MPYSDSGLAWKVSGPGLSARKFNHLVMQDALTIVHSQLEKEELWNFQKVVEEILREPEKNANNKIVPLFRKVDLSFSCRGYNVYEFTNILGRQIQERISLFPSASNIKYTKDELTIFKNVTQDYVREYVERKGMDYLWDRNGLAEYSWDRLSENIVKAALGSQILEPLDDADFRVEVKRNFNSSWDEIKNQIFDEEKISKFKIVESKDLKNKIVELPEVTTLRHIMENGKPFNINMNVFNKDELVDKFGFNEYDVENYQYNYYS